MSVKSRIKIFAKSENLTISAFEKLIEASNGYINSISKSIGIDKIELILEKFPNLNIEWLLIGKGEMLKKEAISQKISNSNNSLNNNIGTVKGNIAISHNDISNLIELQKGSQEERKEFNQRLKTSQEQLNTSQEQINTLLEILKKNK